MQKSQKKVKVVRYCILVNFKNFEEKIESNVNFFEKNHFLLYILSSGCLYVVGNAITPRVRRVGATSKRSNIER